MRFEDHVVLREVFFRLDAGERVGLIGKNGTGKTTMLRLILGQLEAEAGEVSVEQGVRLGYMSQFSQLKGERSVEQILDGLFAEVHDTEAELQGIERALGQEPSDGEVTRLLARQSALLEHMNRIDGWNYTNRIDTVLTRLGFGAEHRARPVDQLSGGWRNRAALAQLLLQAPDVLLLDEPTNYLDVAGLTWLEEHLLDLKGAMILVSHDRHFLDRVATRIVEIEHHGLHDYPGSFSAYVREKPTRSKQLASAWRHEAELLAYEAEALRDRREARRDPGRALKRRLANLKKDREPKPVERIVTSLYGPLRVRDDLCEVEDLGKAYGDQLLFADVRFQLRRGHRLVVVGPNGCGKSTLLRLLTLDEAPDTGSVNWKAGVEFVDFNEAVQSLDPKDTVTHSVNTQPLAFDLPRRTTHRFLELMQFTELDLKKRIGDLSGGQQARVALAHCLLSGAAVVVLDEPTNHLDVTSTQVMERALVHFPGAVVAVSHDRFFIDKVANRLLVFDGDGQVQPVEGNWTMYEAAAAAG